MIRAAGGGPASSRARRRASLPAVNFFGLFLVLLLLMDRSDSRAPGPAARAARTILPFQVRSAAAVAERYSTSSNAFGFTQTS